MFTGLTFFDENFTSYSKDDFSAFFERHERTKHTQLSLSVFSGSEGGDRTHGQGITRISTFP